MKLAILAGGKGTRLGLTSIPKPMVQIGGRSLLEHQILLARDAGIREIFILSGHQADVIFRALGNGSRWGVRLTHIVEPFPLGTAGSVKLLEHLVEERFLVFYGDVALGIGLDRMREYDQRLTADATLLVHPNSHPEDSDLVEMDLSGYITAFHPKPHPEGVFFQNLVNAAVYILSPRVFSFIPEGRVVDFGKDVFPEMLKNRCRLAGYRSLDYAKDLGTPERLHQVRNDYEAKKWLPHRKRRAIFLDRDGVINKDKDSVRTVNDFEVIDGVAEAVRAINASDYLAVVITNQPGLAKGFITETQLAEIHKKMDTVLGREHAYVERVYFCPHHPDKGFPEEIPSLKISCECRKPKPGLIHQAARELNIDLSESWLIGDHPRDIEAGRAAGCRTMMVGSGSSCGEDRRSRDLFQAVSDILSDKAAEVK